MIKSIKGDLLQFEAGIICHQTNFYGVMGGGIAFAIHRDLLTKEQFEEYAEYCELHRRNSLGSVQFIRLNDGRYLANMFSQDDTGKYVPFFKKLVYTDYDAFRKCAYTIERFAKENNLSVAFPGYIGCGIAGGDWTTVSDILDDVFSGSTVECTIVYKGD